MANVTEAPCLCSRPESLDAASSLYYTSKITAVNLAVLLAKSQTPPPPPPPPRSPSEHSQAQSQCDLNRAVIYRCGTLRLAGMSRWAVPASMSCVCPNLYRGQSWVGCLRFAFCVTVKCDVNVIYSVLTPNFLLLIAASLQSRNCMPEKKNQTDFGKTAITPPHPPPPPLPAPLSVNSSQRAPASAHLRTHTHTHTYTHTLSLSLSQCMHEYLYNS